MNRKTRTTTGIFITLTLLLFLGAFSSLANPDQTAECGDCHSVHPSYSLTSNATGTVDVYNGTPFNLEFYASRPSMGGGAFYFSIQSGWANNDNFTFTPTLVQDNQAGDMNAQQYSITVNITFTPTSIGTYTIRAWCASDGGSRSISVSVNVGDPSAPTIDSPPDMEIAEGNMSASVTWNPSDTNPDRYEVYDNEVLFSSDTWNGSSITIGLGTLSLGSHNLTCVVFDVSDNTASDQVDVLVTDQTPPTINHLDNSTVVEGLSAQLTWSPSDLHPSYFDAYREGELVDSDLWSGGDVNVSLAGLQIGEYNYTVVVFDTSGNSAQDTTFVTITDETQPTIDHPTDITYSVNTTGNVIVWTPSDLNPSSFIIYREHVVVRNETWTGVPIIESIDGLGIGVYNYTILVIDMSGNSISDEVTVEVIYPPEPTIDYPEDQNIEEGSTSNLIEWLPEDVDPSRYEIFQDSVLVKSGLWNSSGETISISIDGLSLGEYEFLIIVYDILNHTVSDSVTITVYDATFPIVDSPSDLAMNEGDLGQTITWSASDLNPAEYEIYIDGVLIRFGLWNSSSEVIIASCDGLAYGIHVFTIVVIDVGSNSDSDEVTVTVLDGTSPVVDSPSNIVYQVSTTGHNITWTPTDAHPSNFIVEINGVVILSGGWDGQPIVVNVDWLSVGTYEYTLTVTDVGGNTVSDTVIVRVTLEDPTATTTETTTTTTTDGGEIPGGVDNEELKDAATFSMVILSMGIIVAIMVLGLFIDKRRL